MIKERTKDMKTKVFSILADNTSGVLSRVSGLFNRRGFNIDSFTARETEDPTISRMTVVAKGDDLSLDQIQKQLAKLEDVREVKELKAEHSICRELVIVTVGVTPEERTGLICLVNALHHASIVDIEKDSVMVEMTESHEKINAFIDLLESYEIKEMVRTGIAGLTRGAE